jgi:hypothetical protein
MTDGWISEPFLGGTISLVPANPGKNFKSAIRIEVTAPYQALYLRGPSLRALLEFMEKHPQAVQDVLKDQA